MEIVLGIGKEVCQLVDYYAVTTNRVSYLIDEFDESCDIVPNVIITLVSNVTSALIDWSQEVSNSIGIGFLTAENIDDLTIAIHRNEFCSTSIKSVKHKLVLIDSLNKRIDSFDENNSFLSSEFSKTNIVSALTEGNSIVSLITHSDGIDALLCNSLSLCRFGEEQVDFDKKMPLCSISDHCRRHDMPVKEARQKGYLFHPSNINCQLLVYATCHGILDPDSSVNTKWSIANQLFRSNKIRAVITTIGTCFISRNTVVELFKLLLSGKQLGQVVNEFNRSDTSQMSSLKFILFGDPHLVISPPFSVSDTVSNEKNITKFSQIPNSIFFIRGYITVAFPNCPDSVLPFLNQFALDLMELEYCFWKGLMHQMNRDVIHRYARGLFLFIKNRGQSICTDWMSLCDNHLNINKTTCPACGSKTITSYFKPKVIASYTRTVERCPICSIIIDCPQGWAMDMYISSSSELHFSSSIIIGAATALLISNTYNKSNILCKFKQTNIKPNIKFKIPKNSPKGPLKCSLLVFKDFDIGIFTLSIHSDNVV